MLTESEGGALGIVTYTFIPAREMQEGETLVVAMEGHGGPTVRVYDASLALVKECGEWELKLAHAMAGRPGVARSYKHWHNAEPADLVEWQLQNAVPCEMLRHEVREDGEAWSVTFCPAQPVQAGDRIAIHEWRVAGAPYGYDDFIFFRYDGNEFVEDESIPVEEVRRHTEASRKDPAEARTELAALQAELAQLQQELKTKRRELQGRPGRELTQVENQFADQMADIREKIYDLEGALGL